MIIHFRVQYYVENGRLIRWDLLPWRLLGLGGTLGCSGLLSTPQKAAYGVGAEWFLTGAGGDIVPSW